MTAKKAVRRRRPRLEVYTRDESLTFELLKMEPREQYALISAVRGPDNCVGSPQQYILKCYLTERVRGIVFVGGCAGNYTADSLRASDLARVENALVKGRGSDGFKHYVDHLRLAVKATVDNSIWGGLGYTLLDLLTAASA